MRHTKADFGGISYTEGDFHTPGTSGLGEMSKADFGSMGFSINDAFATIFGDNAALVKQNLQTSATNVAQQTISSNLQTNPNAKQGIIDTTKEAVGAVIKEYGIIIYPVAGLSALALGYGLYNMFKRK